MALPIDPLIIAAIRAAASALPGLVAEIVALANADLKAMQALPIMSYVGSGEKLRLEQAAARAAAEKALDEE